MIISCLNSQSFSKRKENARCEHNEIIRVPKEKQIYSKRKCARNWLMMKRGFRGVARWRKGGWGRTWTKLEGGRCFSRKFDVIINRDSVARGFFNRNYSHGRGNIMRKMKIGKEPAEKFRMSRDPEKYEPEFPQSRSFLLPYFSYVKLLRFSF